MGKRSNRSGRARQASLRDVAAEQRAQSEVIAGLIELAGGADVVRQTIAAARARKARENVDSALAAGALTTSTVVSPQTALLSLREIDADGGTVTEGYLSTAALKPEALSAAQGLGVGGAFPAGTSTLMILEIFDRGNPFAGAIAAAGTETVQ